MSILDNEASRGGSDDARADDSAGAGSRRRSLGNVHVDDVVWLQTRYESVQLLQLHQVLRKADDVLAEAREAAGALAPTTEVAHADLHMMQRHEHGLHDAGRLDVVIELATSRHVIRVAHQRVHVVGRRKSRHAAQFRVLGHHSQLVRTTLAHALAEDRVLATFVDRRASVPLGDCHGARCQDAHGHRRRVRWMKRRKAFATDTAVEQHQVAEDAVHVVHTTQEPLAEHRPVLAGTRRGVDVAAQHGLDGPIRRLCCGATHETQLQTRPHHAVAVARVQRVVAGISQPHRFAHQSRSATCRRRTSRVLARLPPTARVGAQLRVGPQTS